VQLIAKSAIGAQVGGKYFTHDVRVIRTSCCLLSCRIRILLGGQKYQSLKTEFCRAIRGGARCRILHHLEPAVDIDLNQPMADILKKLLSIKTRLKLNGTLIVARDIAHAKIKKRDGCQNRQTILKPSSLLCWSCKTPEGMPSGKLTNWSYGCVR
jgi:fumarate hydratase class I